MEIKLNMPLIVELINNSYYNYYEIKLFLKNKKLCNLLKNKKIYNLAKKWYEKNLVEFKNYPNILECAKFVERNIYSPELYEDFKVFKQVHLKPKK